MAPSCNELPRIEDLHYGTCLVVIAGHANEPLPEVGQQVCAKAGVCLYESPVPLSRGLGGPVEDLGRDHAALHGGLAGNDSEFTEDPFRFRCLLLRQNGARCFALEKSIHRVGATSKNSHATDEPENFSFHN
jgi:hypothetical protein